MYVVCRNGFDDASLKALETKLAAVGGVKRLDEQVFLGRQSQDASLKRKRADQLESLQSGSLSLVDRALTMAAKCGGVRSLGWLGNLFALYHGEAKCTHAQKSLSFCVS